MKIGILGGTFNPIHIGHLILAEEVWEKLGLDKVIFVPTFLAPHKDNIETADAPHRFQMIREAIKGNPHFSVSDLEIRRKGKSYTIDTVRQMKATLPGDELYFIAGSDMLNYLDSWKDLKEILRQVKFVVATRPFYPLEKLPSYVQKVQIRAVDVSAFEIRECVKKKKSFRYLVPDSVYEYIIKHKLYE